MPEVEEAPETVEIPASEKIAINRMADKFRDALKATEPKPSAAATQAQPQPAKPAKAAEAVQPAAQPAQPVETGDPVLPGEIKGKTRESFDRLEGMMKKYRADFETTKAELEKLKKKGSPELDELRKQLEERDRIIKTVAVEKDPRFIQFYGQRTQTAIAEAKEAVGEQASAVVEQVFQLPPGTNRDKELETLADSLDLSDMRRTGLYDAYRGLLRTEKEKAAELAKPEENFKAVQAYQQKLMAAEQERIAQNRAKLWQRFEAEIAPDMEGVDKALADSIRENVASVVAGKANSDQYIAVLSDAARWGRNKSIMAAQAEELEKLRAQLAEVQAANPTVQSNGGPSPRKVAPHPLDHSDVGPKFRKALAGQR